MSLLSLCPKFNINGIFIDCKHCILLGIVQMLMVLWENFPSKEQTWSIGASIGLINENFFFKFSHHPSYQDYQEI